MSKIEKAIQKAIEHNDLPGRVAPVTPVATTEKSATTVAASGSIRSMAQPLLFSSAERAARKIIYTDAAESDVVKAFRELRTKLAQRSAATNDVIMVTGLVDGGGSSFVARNLATAIALESGRTALLVDCNLARPSLASSLIQDGGIGLTDYLDADGIDVSAIIHPTGVERLRVIPAGRAPAGKTEYFTLAKMRRLIQSLKERYPDRQVILDAPPITTSADGQILGALCDHVLLTVPYGRVTERRLYLAIKAVDAQKLVGVVFNDEPVLPPIRWWTWVRSWLAGRGASAAGKQLVVVKERKK